jgi:Signal transduction histidine kinase
MKSIRRSMALAMGGAAVVLLVAGGGGIYFTLRQTLTARFDESLVTKAQALVSASEVDDGKVEVDFDIQSFAGFGSRAPGDYFEIRNADGRSLARSPSLGQDHLEIDPPQRSRGMTFSSITLPDGRPGRAVEVTFSPRDDKRRAFQDLRLIVASDTGRLQTTLQTIATVLVAFGAAGLLASVLIVLAILRVGLRPLAQLAREVQQVDPSVGHRRISVDGLPDELLPVAQKINESLARIEDTFARERRFSSNAAHELRTPLAELKVMTELGVRWPEEFSATHGKEMLAVIAELETLLDRLSLLARADTGPAAVRAENAALDALLAEILHSQEAIAATRNLNLTIDSRGGTVLTDRVLWKAMAGNLVANAIHHAPAGSEVDIRLSPGTLVIANAAPHLEPGDLAQMFERFWRKPSSPGEGKHSGLGLSIARTCAESLGGTCQARLDSGRIVVEATWP